MSKSGILSGLILLSSSLLIEYFKLISKRDIELTIISLLSSLIISISFFYNFASSKSIKSKMFVSIRIFINSADLQQTF